MKIWNKHDGTVIASNQLEHKQNTFILNHYHFFYEQDGWEEKQYIDGRYYLSAEEKINNIPCDFNSLIHYLDYNRAKDKMCLSNAECGQIEAAWLSDDWKTIIRYIKKYTDENPKW